jgi:superfamily II DNA or RNA helicase
MKNILEKIIEEKSYDDLGHWCLNNLKYFSEGKNLFEYQQQAIRNITKVLHEYFNVEKSKHHFFKLYKSYGIKDISYSVKKYQNRKDKQLHKINSLFSLFQNHFKINYNNGDEFISGHNFMNRACFWMATGSGKSIVLIKTIELIDYLQSQGLIPKREILLLLPREDLINQFMKEIEEFNIGREKGIQLVNLKQYEEDKQRLAFNSDIKVYYYRSDLLRDERKENILDYRSYENNGNWYVFLDEAHRGVKENSLMQGYVTILSKNGFLFNFSATFTDDIDYATTCYNFNLEKFILAGYGKNLYLSQSIFNFTNDKEDFSERDKQKQVLKSLIIFTFIKKQKKENLYHNPLLITLVNSVQNDNSKNKKDADLLLFFKKLEEIAEGSIKDDLFNETKDELQNELKTYTNYIFGEEKFYFDSNLFKNIKLKDILNAVFNSKTNGKISFLEGEKGKEIVLQLQTSETPFALIKIGDAKKFIKNNLDGKYEMTGSFDSKKYFDNINKNKDINLLLGSRSFYEGWDSNRPNIINMINIGKQDAKKYALQSIGRGIRIEPKTGYRKRLSLNDPDKNILLETLFVFATDKNAVKAIIESIENEKNKEEQEISLFDNLNKPFDLLIPIYADANSRGKIAKFNISCESLKDFKNYIFSFDKNTLLLKTQLSKHDLYYLLDELIKGDIFQIKNENTYRDMEMLLKRLTEHISVKNKVVSGIKEVENEIIHFKNIKVINFSDEEYTSFKRKVINVKDFEMMDKKEIEEKYRNHEISFEEATILYGASKEDSFKDLKIKKIAEHYYLPLIYSEIEKVEYIKHIINVKSEVRFIENLEKYIKNSESSNQWMFSKIDESLDKINIPYFYKKENIYRNFFPDFIFWVKKGFDYKIVFVDPKGTSNADYQNKVDEFEKLFFENNEAKVFKYKNYNITFDLKLIANDVNSVGEKYKNYWLGNNDFSFLEIK